MADYYDKMHGRIKALIKRSGGYDLLYHIEKVAKENDIELEIVKRIFLMTHNEELRNHYIKLYKQGSTIEEIHKLHMIRARKSLFSLEMMAHIINMNNRI